MNVQFGTGFTISQNTTGAQGSEARSGVAVPVEADNQSTTSFAPVQEANESPKPRQEDAQKGSEERQAVEQRRARAQQEERQTQQRAERRLEREAQLEQAEQAQSKRSEDAQQKQTQQENQAEDVSVDRSQEEQRAQERRQQDAQEQRQLEAEQKQIQKLAERDREVRAHEQAHQAVGGQYAGAISLTYKRGPDGQNYAVAGEVPIDTSKVANDPQATLDKAETIRRAALAPAEPSSQDRRVAAMAIQMSVEARAEIQQQQQEVQTEESNVEEESESKSLSEEERLDAEQKAQQQEQNDENNERFSADFQELNERLARIQAQLVEASQIGDKVNAGVNLLDVTT